MTVKLKADIGNPSVPTGYLVDGTMTVPIAGGNRHYKEVQEWIAQGNIPEPAYTQEEIAAHTLSSFTELVEQIVQNEVDIYNTVNGTLFPNIESTHKYTRKPKYTHYVWCTAVLDWNEDVWETARQIQIDVMTGTIPQPTKEEFLAMLPIFGA